jgi:hypothetical protein
MFGHLIESIRFESSQSGSSKERTPGQGAHSSGAATSPGQKKSEIKADKKKRRRMGREAAAAGDGEYNVGKPGGNKVPKHPRKIKPWGSREGYYPPGSTRKGRHRQRMRQSAEPSEEGVQDVVDKVFPGRAKKKADRKADDKRRNDNFAKSQESLKQAVARIRTRH